MIIEPVLDKPVYLKKEEKIERIVGERLERKNEFIFDKSKVKSNVRLNLYFIVAIVFLVGIVMGSIVFRLMIEDPNVEAVVLENFILDFEGDEEALFKKSFEKNIKILVIYWIAGVSIVGAPLLLLLCVYKGFSTAFAISACLLKYGFFDGNIYIFKNIFFYYIFQILGIILLTASSLKVTWNVFKGEKDIRYELIRHSIFTIIAFCLFIISTVLEVKIV